MKILIDKIKRFFEHKLLDDFSYSIIYSGQLRFFEATYTHKELTEYSKKTHLSLLDIVKDHEFLILSAYYSMDPLIKFETALELTQTMTNSDSLEIINYDDIEELFVKPEYKKFKFYASHLYSTMRGLDKINDNDHIVCLTSDLIIDPKIPLYTILQRVNSTNIPSVHICCRTELAQIECIILNKEAVAQLKNNWKNIFINFFEKEKDNINSNRPEIVWIKFFELSGLKIIHFPEVFPHMWKFRINMDPEWIHDIDSEKFKFCSKQWDRMKAWLLEYRFDKNYDK
jgi:hypothetical protein